MATISLSDTAPSGEKIHFSLANEEFALGADADASYDSNDPTVVANAESHPWLSVEYPEPDEEPAPEAAEETPLAAEAGIDQDNVWSADASEEDN